MAHLSRIAPELPVADVHAALYFYEHYLGFEVSMMIPDGPYAIVERDDIAVHLFLDAERTHSAVGIHLFVDDIEELRDELMGRGTRLSQDILRKPWGNRDFRVHDEYGNEFKFTEPLPRDE
ncbi:MAG TPA: glyoxalase superfamily protein [Terracidiphilus sp.]|jgi:uncharacterized glyoxalase superfamily protein PhnB